KPSLVGDNPPEMGDPMNDTLAGAEALTMQDLGNGFRGGFILSDLPLGDVDYFSFDVMPMEHISAVCSSASSGSGIRDLLIETRARMDSSIGMQNEVLPNTAFIQDLTVPSTGTYYLRLSRGAQDPQVTGHFARCAVRTFMP